MTKKKSSEEEEEDKDESSSDGVAAGLSKRVFVLMATMTKVVKSWHSVE